MFADIVGRGQNVFLEYANQIKKISFPCICLPVIVVFNAEFNFSPILGLFILLLLLTGTFPRAGFAVLFPVLIIQIASQLALPDKMRVAAGAS